MRARSTILGLAVLTILLTAGAAQSLSGSNTVFTDDIAPGAVNFSDIHENAVTSSRIANGGVFSGDIADNSITGADIRTLAPKVLHALVYDFNGYKVRGDATGLTHPSTGRYVVTFPRNVAGCDAVGSIYPNTYGYHAPTSLSIYTSSTGVSVYTTYTHENGAATLTDAQFSLIVVCP